MQEAEAGLLLELVQLVLAALCMLVLVTSLVLAARRHRHQSNDIPSSGDTRLAQSESETREARAVVSPLHQTKGK